MTRMRSSETIGTDRFLRAEVYEVHDFRLFAFVTPFFFQGGYLASLVHLLAYFALEFVFSGGCLFLIHIRHYFWLEVAPLLDN